MAGASGEKIIRRGCAGGINGQRLNEICFATLEAGGSG
jgi:hypothetical protein